MAIFSRCFTRVLVPSAPVLVGVLQTLQVAAQIADLEAAVASRDQQIDELRSELSDIVSRLEVVESG